MSRIVMVNYIVQNPDRVLVIGIRTEQASGQDKIRVISRRGANEGTMSVHSVSIHVSSEMKSTIGTTNGICIRFSN